MVLKLYMDKCEGLKNHLLPIQCLLVMIDRVSREMPYAHKNILKAKKAGCLMVLTRLNFSANILDIINRSK